MAEDRAWGRFVARVIVTAVVLSLIGGGGLGVTGCEEERGPAERAGEKIDEAAEEAGDKAEEAVDEATEN